MSDEGKQYQETLNYSALLLASIRDVQVALRCGFYGKMELMILASAFNKQLDDETKDELLKLEQEKEQQLTDYHKIWVQKDGARKTILMTPERQKIEFEIQQQEVMQALKVIIKAMDKFGLLFTPSTRMGGGVI